jgi:hypothetical protein
MDELRIGVPKPNLEEKPKEKKKEPRVIVLDISPKQDNEYKI